MGKHKHKETPTLESIYANPVEKLTQVDDSCFAVIDGKLCKLVDGEWVEVYKNWLGGK